MTHLPQNSRKTGPHFLLEVNLEGSPETPFRLERTLLDSLPGHTNLNEGNWNAGQILLGALAAGWAETWLAYAQREQLPWLQLRCRVIGQLRPVSGGYAFSTADLYPELQLKAAADYDRAVKLLKKSERQNPAARSLGALVFYHSRLLLRPE